MKLESKSFRARSTATLGSLGYVVPEHLPLIYNPLKIRDATEIQDRCLSLNCIVAVAFGFSLDKAHSWLLRNNLVESVARNEANLLKGEHESVNSMKAKVESLWTLAWILGLAKHLDILLPCDDYLVRLLPDLKKDESAATFRDRCGLRSESEIGEMLDLYYCVDWLYKDACFNGDKLSDLLPHVKVRERRLALEWVTCVDDWDDISLDT